MAGTDPTRADITMAGDPAPVFVLVRPQLAENIGTAARAMLNCGLARMRLVAPQADPLHPRALAAASGADAVLRGAEVFPTVTAAIADLHRVYAASARRRELVKPVMTPRLAAGELRAAVAQGDRVGVLFGPERTGLENDEITLADTIIEAPLNSAYASLNLAQAVLVVGYEWFQAGTEAVRVELPHGGTRPATRAELVNFFEHLERELDECGFLRVIEKRPSMVRNIRTLFERASLTEQEVRTLHGMVKELRWGRMEQKPDGKWGRVRRPHNNEKE